MRIIKGAGVDPEDGEILGEFVWDQESRHKMHGSDPKWERAVARGSQRRMSEKPQTRAGARNTRRP